ncbi:hypothetical protein Tco_1353118 [Tanacetum coccineum]
MDEFNYKHLNAALMKNFVPQKVAFRVSKNIVSSTSIPYLYKIWIKNIAETSKSLETTFVAPKTRFSEKETQSKTLDTTSVVSKSKIDVESASKAKDKVVQIVSVVVDSGCSKHMTGDRSLLRNFIEKFMGTVRFGNDNFAAITGYGNYIHGNILFVMYIMLKVLDITSLALDNFVMEI